MLRRFYPVENIRGAGGAGPGTGSRQMNFSRSKVDMLSYERSHHTVVVLTLGRMYFNGHPHVFSESVRDQSYYVDVLWNGFAVVRGDGDNSQDEGAWASSKLKLNWLQVHVFVLFHCIFCTQKTTEHKFKFSFVLNLTSSRHLITFWLAFICFYSC